MAISNEGIINCKLFPGQMQDCKSIYYLWENWPWKEIKMVVADKGYDASGIRTIIKEKGAIPVIPFKRVLVPQGSDLTPEDFYDTEVYSTRHVIERLFGRIKENKRLCTRFDKMDFSFLGFIALAVMKLYKLLC